MMYAKQMLGQENIEKKHRFTVKKAPLKKLRWAGLIFVEKIRFVKKNQ